MIDARIRRVIRVKSKKGRLAVTWLLLYFIDTIYRFLGETVCLVLSKILSLFLAAIGIHLLMKGITQYFKV